MDFDAFSLVVDLPLPNTFGETDKYRLFECSLPFPRIDVNTFCVWVKMAHTDCGEEGYVTLKSLRSHFKSPAWKDLEDENSDFAKFLLSSAFKNDEKGLASDQICISALILFAVLNCQGKLSDKCEHFFNEIQEGGTATHKHVSAGDKDIAPVIEKLCGLASFELFQCQSQVGEIYTASECDSLKEKVEDLREDQYLEDVFGPASRLETEEWVQAMCTKADWIFDSKQLRKRLLELAEIEPRHN